MPFQSVFLFQEMRVRGRWPLKHDRDITLPLQPQQWMSTADDDTDTGSHDYAYGSDEGYDCETTSDIANAMSDPTSFAGSFSQQQTQNSDCSLHYLADSTPRTITITNPFANRTELEALRQSFTQEPNWIATVIENESWDGTAEENAAKWKGLRALDLIK
jgi:hypothetical protein